MFPLLWFWAPQYHFPFSGSVAQRIEPDFFSAIPASAGKGDVEREAVEVASYGRQLGLISEVLLAQTDPELVPPAKARKSLKRLKEIYGDVEAVKARHQRSRLASALEALEELEKENPAALALLVQRFSASQARLPSPSR